MPEKLKPCPACGGDAWRRPVGYASCSSAGCHLIGPDHDPDGAKWNALPRRTDASQGMSDGELIARMLVWLIEVVAVAHDVENEAGDEIDAELDRRAAARKESK